MRETQQRDTAIRGIERKAVAGDSAHIDVDDIYLLRIYNSHYGLLDLYHYLVE